jgi:hypothetical protein
VGELVWSLVVISAIVGEVVDSWVWNCGERLKEEWINGAQRGNRGCRPVSSKRGRRALGASAKGSAREGRGVATAGGRVRGVEWAIDSASSRAGRLESALFSAATSQQVRG